MNILALDLGTHTGWAMCEGDRMESGVQDFSKKRGESNGMLFLHFNRWLRSLAPPKEWPSAWGPRGVGFPFLDVHLVVWEQAHHRGGAATSIAVGLATRVEEFCAERQIEHASVHSMTLKKWATGSGRASKEDMVGAAIILKRAQVIDDNEADAILLLEYARKEIVGAGPVCAKPVRKD